MDVSAIPSQEYPKTLDLWQKQPKTILRTLPTVLFDQILTYLDPRSLAKYLKTLRAYWYLPHSKRYWQERVLSLSTPFQPYSVKFIADEAARLAISVDLIWLRLYGQHHLGDRPEFSNHDLPTNQDWKISCLAQLPTGRLVSGSEDGRLGLWYPNEHGVLPRLIGQHTGSITCIKTLSNGQFVAGSVDGMASVWDKEGHTRHVTYQYRGPVTSLTPLAEGGFASCPNNSVIHVQYPATQSQFTLRGHQGRITSLIDLPNRLLASGSSDCTIRIWDLEKRALKYRLLNQLSPVTCLTARNDHLLWGDASGWVSIWNLEKLKRIHHFFHAHAPVFCLVDLPNGYLAVGTLKGKISFLNLKTPEIFEFKINIEENIVSLVPYQINKLAILCKWNCMHVWDASSHQGLKLIHRKMVQKTFTCIQNAVSLTCTGIAWGSNTVHISKRREHPFILKTIEERAFPKAAPLNVKIRKSVVTQQLQSVSPERSPAADTGA